MKRDKQDGNLAKKLEKTEQTLEMIRSQLVQAGKMAALGQLSAGIAHELKQPLTGIMGFMDEALEDLELENDNPVIESLNIVKKEAERMQNIVNGIRKFSRASGIQKEPIDINIVINESLLLLRKQLENHNVKVETTLDENLPKAFANASQMQQVFVNMIANARDAMETKGCGTLTVKTALLKDDKYIEVFIKDTGCGMPKDVIKKLAEPFFTTKGPEKGTGLGTSISFSIIEDHNGNIDISSKVGSGTTIKITIPVAD